MTCSTQCPLRTSRSTRKKETVPKWFEAAPLKRQIHSCRMMMDLPYTPSDEAKWIRRLENGRGIRKR